MFDLCQRVHTQRERERLEDSRGASFLNFRREERREKEEGNFGALVG